MSASGGYWSFFSLEAHSQWRSEGMSWRELQGVTVYPKGCRTAWNRARAPYSAHSFTQGVRSLGGCMQLLPRDHGFRFRRPSSTTDRVWSVLDLKHREWAKRRPPQSRSWEQSNFLQEGLHYIHSSNYVHHRRKRLQTHQAGREYVYIYIWDVNGCEWMRGIGLPWQAGRIDRILRF